MGMDDSTEDFSEVEAAEVVEPLTIEAALALQGSGWLGDLDEMRSSRVE